jgi:catechol 2,3-dioxygenase-like lactoylglutathione lyase family enzyme
MPSVPGAPVLDHVQVAAPRGSEPEARRFYGELLGLSEIPKPPPLRDRGGVWFALGHGQLHIGVAEPFTPARKAHPALRFGDPERLRDVTDRLLAADAPVRWVDDLPEVRRCFTDDPWGNRLELLTAAPRRTP